MFSVASECCPAEYPLNPERIEKGELAVTREPVRRSSVSFGVEQPPRRNRQYRGDAAIVLILDNEGTMSGHLLKIARSR
jgi:hypothetical protein